TVTLALAEAREAARGGEAVPGETIIDYQGERRRILVVDDSAENRAVLRDMLVPLGFEFAEVPSGEAALRSVMERRPALILMDLSMPGLDGYETTRRLREMPELGPVVIMAISASISGPAQKKSLGAGCNDFLPKPVQVEALLG